MRTLLRKLGGWWYDRSPRRIPDLVGDVERLFDMHRELQSEVAAATAVVDRFVAPRLAAKEVLDALSHLPDAEALALLEQAIKQRKAEGAL